MYFFLHEIDTMKCTQKEAHEVQLPYLNRQVLSREFFFQVYFDFSIKWTNMMSAWKVRPTEKREPYVASIERLSLDLT